jgi:hypothetical protein
MKTSSRRAKTLSHLSVARWCPFCCLVLSELVISFLIRYDIIKTLIFCAYILTVCMIT